MALELGPATGRLINSKSPGTANHNSQRIIKFDRTPIKIRVRLCPSLVFIVDFYLRLKFTWKEIIMSKHFL